jgi:hypothetical protein
MYHSHQFHGLDSLYLLLVHPTFGLTCILLLSYTSVSIRGIFQDKFIWLQNPLVANWDVLQVSALNEDQLVWVKYPVQTLCLNLFPFVSCGFNYTVMFRPSSLHHVQSTCLPVCKCKLYYITFSGSIVSQSDCRMWNKSYKYKNTYTVHLKHSQNTYTHTHIN